MTETSAFNRFKKTSEAKNLSFVDGPYTATVTCVASSWSWVVWREGGVVGAYRSFDMGAREACEQAIECIDSSKAIRRPTIDEFFTTKDI